MLISVSWILSYEDYFDYVHYGILTRLRVGVSADTWIGMEKKAMNKKWVNHSINIIHAM